MFMNLKPETRAKLIEAWSALINEILEPPPPPQTPVMELKFAGPVRSGFSVITASPTEIEIVNLWKLFEGAERTSIRKDNDGYTISFKYGKRTLTGEAARDFVMYAGNHGIPFPDGFGVDLGIEIDAEFEDEAESQPESQATGPDDPPRPGSTRLSYTGE